MFTTVKSRSAPDDAAPDFADGHVLRNGEHVSVVRDDRSEGGAVRGSEFDMLAAGTEAGDGDVDRFV